MKYPPTFICIILVSLIGSITALNKLQSYNVDLAGTTVSGLSSGGFMAVQMNFAFSSNIKGAAIYAGGPYYCSGGNILEVYTACSVDPSWINVNALLTYTRAFSNAGTIDNVSNLSGQNIYVFSGTADTIVKQGVCQVVESMYSQLGANVTTSFNLPAEHCWPTDNFGNSCGFKGEPYINNCNYNGALAGLTTIYGQLNPPTAELDKNLFEFAQSEFTKAGDGLNMAAYVYVPTACQQGAKCRLHISFHGCNMTLADIQTTFVKNNEVNPIAEANNLIVLFPQIVKSQANPANPGGCWDYWGYTEPPHTQYKTTFPTKNGAQTKAIWAMAQRIAGGKSNVNIDFLATDF